MLPLLYGGGSILLTMNDFQAINDIVNESIRSSSYISVAIASGIFVCYTLIVKLIEYFKAKQKTKPLIEMANALRENTENIVKLNSVLDKTLKDAERKELRQCETAIQTGFAAIAFNIMQALSSVVVHNNIEDNKELVVDNIRKLVSSEYYKLYSALSAFEIKGVNVATKLDENWIKEITDNVISIIYNKQDAMTRITQLSNRISLHAKEYSTYINNKIFNT